MPKCYMCDSDSTSVEHAPPRGFFPTGQRTNLITVPSCQSHNEDTSKDDEYVRNIITTSIENNQTSMDHFLDKSLRSYQRSPGLTSEVIKSLKDVSFHKENAKAFQFDRERFDKIIRKIAYALFYKEFEFTWERLLAVTTNQIKMTDMTNDHLGELFETLSDDLNELVLKGENPLVFQYSFIEFGTDPHDKAIFMLFYEGFPFWIIPDKTSSHNDFN
jgi:hypothetical protein